MVSSVFARKAVRGSFIIAIAALVALPVVAAQGPGRGPGNGPCAEDMAKYCKDVQPGGGRILECMKEHENDLSPACKQHIADMKERTKESRQACHDDVMKFCKDVPAGGGGIMKCLKEHENDLSPECKTHMESRKGRM